MTAERSQLYYTCTFLQVSFQALQASLEESARDPAAPCWLDTRLIEMLSGEVRRCRREAAHCAPLHQPLDAALYHCGLLLTPCPGDLDRPHCHHHLDAIVALLKDSSALLALPCARATGPWQAAARHLRGWWHR